MKQGIVEGYPEGTFKPNALITRAEFVMMLMNALKLTSEDATLSFTDTQRIPDWAKNVITQSVEAGIVSGYDDGSFRPFANITRMEVAVMIAKAYGRTPNKRIWCKETFSHRVSFF
ncbi:S-layer homology domain-containing protein [Paenibacillus agricola]|uniref:S-layer homology domain-containing protein n=1 Tax=Paenibacillus agricola TaxID=2716264 RepID=A0ABX0JFR3_9BACL|nr:S-layer homology domain-containing protein [Paenibacillus agricola]NHN33069.1 S-layer homology domain-containing protein [Paenibacillus agricola]